MLRKMKNTHADQISPGIQYLVDKIALFQKPSGNEWMARVNTNVTLINREEQHQLSGQLIFQLCLSKVTSLSPYLNNSVQRSYALPPVLDGNKLTRKICHFLYMQSNINLNQRAGNGMLTGILRS